MENSAFTYAKLLEGILNMPLSWLERPVQIVMGTPDGDAVQVCHEVIAFDTIDNLGYTYIRSAVDNKRRGDDFVLLCDQNLFQESGQLGFRQTDDGTTEPIFPNGHCEAADWRGPAQRLYDKEKECGQEESSEEAGQEGGRREVENFGKEGAQEDGPEDAQARCQAQAENDDTPNFWGSD